MQHFYREDETFVAGTCVPYQVRLDGDNEDENERLIFVSVPSSVKTPAACVPRVLTLIDVHAGALRR